MNKNKAPIVGINHLVEQKIRNYFNQLDGSIPAGELYSIVINEVEKPLFQVVLEATNWNKLKAAEVLGINRNTLSKKILHFNIQKPAKRAA